VGSVSARLRQRLGGQVKIREELDNPLVFVVLMTAAVFSLGRIFEWWAKARHHDGTAVVFGAKHI
jgi:hypothetical protein